jgi:SHS2 domain-containing protein
MDPDQHPYEILEHPADIGFLARGRTLRELFANAALAMMSLGWELDAVEELERREIEASGEDLESLLYDWLSAVLATADADRLIFSRFEVNVEAPRAPASAPEAPGTPAEPQGLARGVAWGEPIDRSRHHPRTYVKAVTYHQFEVRQTDHGYTARVYLDV